MVCENQRKFIEKTLCGESWFCGSGSVSAIVLLGGLSLTITHLVTFSSIEKKVFLQLSPCGHPHVCADDALPLILCWSVDSTLWGRRIFLFWINTQCPTEGRERSSQRLCPWWIRLNLHRGFYFALHWPRFARNDIIEKRSRGGQGVSFK